MHKLNSSQTRLSATIFFVLIYYIACIELYDVDFDIHFGKNQLQYQDELWETPETLGVKLIKDATIMPNGLVFNKTKEYSFGKWYFENKNAKFSRPTDYKHGYYFSFIQIWQQHFQHIAFDTIPRIRLLCNTIQEHTEIGLLVAGLLQRDLMIEACPLPKDRFSIIKQPFSATVIAPVVWLPDLYPMGIVPPNSFSSLGPQNNQGTKVIYVPRSEHSRRVSNEREVIDLLQKYFYRELWVYYPQNDWTKDKEVFSQAKIIVGPHGGAMGNIIFAPINTTIIEFLSLTSIKKKKKNERPCYFGLAKGMGFSYFSVEPTEFSFNGPMMVPIDKLENILLDHFVLY